MWLLVRWMWDRLSYPSSTNIYEVIESTGNCHKDIKFRIVRFVDPYAQDHKTKLLFDFNKRTPPHAGTCDNLFFTSSIVLFVSYHIAINHIGILISECTGTL
jgi:hypothetical protein